MPYVGVARSAVRALPSGALTVGGGLLVLGLSSYGFLLVSAHALTPTTFAGLSVLYVLVFTVGPGLFLPFEQELGRALADRRARGVGGGRLLRRAAWAAAAALAVLLALTAASAPFVRPRLFDGSWLLFGALLLALVGLCAAYLTRGVFAGTGRFGSYGAQLAVEGGSRLAGCVVLAVAGVHAVGWYGLVLSAAFLVAVVGTARALPRREPAGPPAPWAELGGTLGWLLAGSLLAQVLVNGGPVAAKVLAAGGQDAAAGRLLAGLVLARLPLFLFAAVQAALLPRLAAQLAAGRLAEFGAGLTRLLRTVLALSGLMTLLLAAVGPQLLRVLFGPGFRLGRLDLVLLSAATGLFMAATVLGNGLLALRRFARAAAGWGTGVAVFLAVLAAPLSLYARVEYSFLAGALAAAGAFAVLLRAATVRDPVAVPRPGLGQVAVMDQ